MKRFAMSLSVVLAAAAMPAHAQMTTAGPLHGAESWYLRTRDGAGELFVFEVGTGKSLPVVVLHGGPGADLTYMLPVANGLESEFRFVFYDQRGSLRSRVAPDSITMAKHVADLEQLREALGAERLQLVSHSAGTMLAFEYLRAYPNRVANLALVGALPHKNGPAYYDAEYAALWRGLSDSANAFASRDAVMSEVRKANLNGANLTLKQASQLARIQQVGAESFHVERWRETLPMRVSPDAARRTRQSTNFEYDVGPLLAKHTSPVTVINGEFDYTVGPRGSPLWRKLAATTARNIRVVVIPSASHIVWFDDPAAFRSALRGALLR